MYLGNRLNEKEIETQYRLMFFIYTIVRMIQNIKWHCKLYSESLKQSRHNELSHLSHLEINQEHDTT